jgi:hypothetical protein
MRRFRTRTLAKTNSEALVIAAGQNAKRLLAFGGRRPKRPAQAAALRPVQTEPPPHLDSSRRRAHRRERCQDLPFFNRLERFRKRTAAGSLLGILKPRVRSAPEEAAKSRCKRRARSAGWPAVPIGDDPSVVHEVLSRGLAQGRPRSSRVSRRVSSGSHATTQRISPQEREVRDARSE